MKQSLLALLLVLVGACSSDSGPPPITALGDLEPYDGFGSATLVVDGEQEWPVLVADTASLRSQGLMSVTDLGPWAGMVFVWEEPTDGGFWMKDTLIPLSIYWLDGDGAIVAIAEMVPCPPDEDDCPRWRPGVHYLTALEVPAGMGEQLGIDSNSILTLREGLP